MTPSESLQTAPEIAGDFVAALARVLGDDVSLDVGAMQTAPVALEGDDAPNVTVVDATFADGTNVSIALITRLQNASIGQVLTETAHAIARLAGTTADVTDAREADLAALNGADASTVAYPIVEGPDVVGSLVINVTASDDDGGDEVLEPVVPQPSAGRGATDKVLADVQMGVTAELGRSVVTIRELLSIAPGTVVDLDRAATAPVDVLVNGTVIARGEVVVIDEEFGVRILEIMDRD